MKKTKLTLSTLVLIILAFALVSADVGSCGYGMGEMMYGSYGYGGLLFSWIFGFLVIAILLLLIIWLFKQIQKK
jgi:uncharacterized membrane protein